jgi:hypothetical protein
MTGAYSDRPMGRFSFSHSHSRGYSYSRGAAAP